MSRPPSFVIVMTDTQNTRLVGAYGEPGVRTPNLDALAAGGAVFERAYTSCPVCTPARAGLFTGLPPHAAGAWANLIPLHEGVRTMGQRFRDNGYDTAFTGKWHLAGHDYFDTGTCPPGWDEATWYDGRNHLDSLSPDERKLWRQGLNSYEDLKRHRIKAEFTWAHRASDRAIEFLRRRRDRPFLLVVSYDEPHHPSTCPPEFVEPFLDFGLDPGPSRTADPALKPAHVRAWMEHAHVPAAGDGRVRWPLFFGCNSFADHEAGRVIEAVREAEPDAWIVYTSDHGDMLGAHRLTNKGPAMYDEIARIPLIVRGPGVPPGSRNRSVTSHLDILPTMLDLAGLPVPPAMPGRSMRGTLLSGSPETGRDAFVEYHRYEVDHERFGEYQPIRCLVRGPWKLVLNLHTTDELYNLERDPRETVNLIGDEASVAERDRMHDNLLDWMDRSRDPWRGSYWARRPWRDAKRSDWTGGTRFNPPDGYRPEFLDYDTGFPPTTGYKPHG